MATDDGRKVRLALLASPLLGPAVWAGVADELTRRGWDVLLPPPYDGIETPGDVLDHLLAAIPASTPVVVVPHSNAGLYAAALAAERDVRALVFVDAGLPSEGPMTPTAPPAFREFLATLVQPDGRLPGWTRWWDADEIEDLFPDASTRAAVEAEQARLPLEYFAAEVPSPAGWEQLPAAYLGFGDTYTGERAAAERRGWPVETVAGEHLHTLRDPAAVAAGLVGLLRLLGLVRPR